MGLGTPAPALETLLLLVDLVGDDLPVREMLARNGNFGILGVERAVVIVVIHRETAAAVFILQTLLDHQREVVDEVGGEAGRSARVQIMVAPLDEGPFVFDFLGVFEFETGLFVRLVELYDGGAFRHKGLEGILERGERMRCKGVGDHDGCVFGLLGCFGIVVRGLTQSKLLNFPWAKFSLLHSDNPKSCVLAKKNPTPIFESLHRQNCITSFLVVHIFAILIQATYADIKKTRKTKIKLQSQRNNIPDPPNSSMNPSSRHAQSYPSKHIQNDIPIQYHHHCTASNKRIKLYLKYNIANILTNTSISTSTSTSTSTFHLNNPYPVYIVMFYMSREYGSRSDVDQTGTIVPHYRIL